MNENEKFSNIIITTSIFQYWKIKKFSYLRTKRPDHGLLYVEKGQINFYFNNNCISATEGDIIFLPKGTNYEAEFIIGDDAVFDLLINFDHLTDAKLFGFMQPTLILKDTSKLLLSDFSAVAQSFKQNDHVLLTLSLFLKLLHGIIKFKDGSKKYDYLKKAATLLYENPQLSVDDLCKAVNKSRSVIQKDFNAIYGLSPIQYKNKARLNRAKQLLITTDTPISEIAELLCFYDAAYFCKCFEKNVGLSPSTFREQNFTRL